MFAAKDNFIVYCLQTQKNMLPQSRLINKKVQNRELINVYNCKWIGKNSGECSAVRGVRGLFLLIFLSACASKKSLQSMVDQHNYQQSTHYSDNFQHIVYANQAYYLNANDTLYVYLEGDGLPWKTPTQISADPDPLYPLALDLMSLNTHPSVYLQRPCYGFKEMNCDLQWWTNKRYSQEVVESMLQVLKSISGKYQKIILVGYSGGGALAVLMARKLDKVSRLITLAANLNIQKWTDYHGYSPLSGSINPADIVLPAQVRQFHFSGQKDLNILPEWVKAFSDKQANSEFILLQNIDHSCCWLKNWPRIIDQINKTVVK